MDVGGPEERLSPTRSTHGQWTRRSDCLYQATLHLPSTTPMLSSVSTDKPLNDPTPMLVSVCTTSQRPTLPSPGASANKALDEHVLHVLDEIFARGVADLRKRITIEVEDEVVFPPQSTNPRYPAQEVTQWDYASDTSSSRVVGIPSAGQEIPERLLASGPITTSYGEASPNAEVAHAEFKESEEVIPADNPLLSPPYNPFEIDSWVADSVPQLESLPHGVDDDHMTPTRDFMDEDTEIVDAHDLNDIRSGFSGDLSMYITRDGEFPVAAGGCADIYKGTLRFPPKTIKVAIKVIKVYSAEDNHPKKTKRLRREIKVWMKLNHPNVLSLFGITSGFGPFPAMVCPWLENGTLTSYLECCGAILQILALTCDVASGLQYLHWQSIVHGDLSGSNVLIDANGRARIADFGLSTILDEIGSTFATSSTGKPRGTLRWAAPELLDLVDHGDAKTQHTGPTTQSDIYSFGGIMFQILSGKVPYHYYSRDMQIVAAIFKGETTTRPDNPRVTDNRWGFIQRCWSSFRNVVQRPSSEEVVAFSTDELCREFSDEA
ncbi:kinase-like protein [Imleria badia]|nr:kinase-like protein [Imleria badia]